MLGVSQCKDPGLTHLEAVPSSVTSCLMHLVDKRGQKKWRSPHREGTHASLEPGRDTHAFTCIPLARAGHLSLLTVRKSGSCSSVLRKKRNQTLVKNPVKTQTKV